MITYLDMDMERSTRPKPKPKQNPNRGDKERGQMAHLDGTGIEKLSHLAMIFK